MAKKHDNHLMVIDGQLEMHEATTTQEFIFGHTSSFFTEPWAHTFR